MRCLVTGGAGFIGSHLADDLLRRGYAVTVLDDLSGGYLENVPSGANFIEGSILDHDLLENLFDCLNFKYVFHVAAYATEGLSHFIKRFNYLNNLVGSVNLINASVNHNVERFVFTSSMAVYGEQQVPMREDMVPSPEDSYGIAKRAVEQELEVSQNMFGLDYTVIRPHSVYGERQNLGDRYRNVVGIFMNQVLRGEQMTVFGDGSQVRSFTYIGDLVPFISLAAEIPDARNQVFNVGRDEPVTIMELAEMVADAMGVECKVEYLDKRYEVHTAFLDHTKAETTFGMQARTSLNEGLCKMSTWAKRSGSRECPIFNGIEVSKNLLPVWRDAR